MAGVQILVGLTVNPTSSPSAITESFDGENESVNHSKLVQSFTDLKTDMKKYHQQFNQQTQIIGTKSKGF